MSAYRDLFLIASVGRRRNLRVRLMTEQPEQREWLTLGPASRSRVRQESSGPELSMRLDPDEMFGGDADLMQAINDAARSRSVPNGLAQQAAEAWWYGSESWLRHGLESLLANSNDTIRLNVVSASPSLWHMPWEWLEIPLREVFPGARIVVNRAVPMRYTPPRLRVEGGLRLLTLASNPKDERKMNVYQELEAIRLPPGMIRQDSREAYGPDVATEIATSQPNIIHYVGHAGMDGEEGSLILENSRGSSEWLNPRAFQALLSPAVRLLCLATCVTVSNYDIRGFAGFALGDSGGTFTDLPSIVFTQFPVTPESSELFWARFYEVLAGSEANLSDAVDAARDSVRKASPNSADWSSFVLVLREHFDSRTGQPFLTPSQESGLPGVSGSSEKATKWKLNPEELESYFASRLANQLESLQSDDLPDTLVKRIQTEVEQAKRMITD